MKQRFEVLDGWRGVAALAVAIFHLVISNHFQSFGVIANGSHFVDFFFVLSGFVITYAYMDALQSGLSPASFMIRRFGRLWPLHAAILAILILREFAKIGMVYANLIPQQPIFSGEAGTSVTQIIEHVFFIQAVGIDHTHSWNGPSWSISTEIWTYVIFVCVCLLFRGRNLIFAALLIASSGAAYVWLFSPHYMVTSFEYGMPRCVYGFFVGVLTYRVYASGRFKIGIPWVAEIGALALVVGYVSYTNLQSTNPWTMLAPIAFAPAVLIFAFEAGPISNVMRSKPFIALGAWSYSIYMVHDFIAFVVIKFVKGCAMAATTTDGLALYRHTCLAIVPSKDAAVFSNPWLLDAVTIVYIAIVIAVAALTFRFVETPGRLFFNKLAKRYEGKPVQTVEQPA